MLSAEKNERLTRVGPGTPMGELLRRYWWPVATHDMATRVPVKRRLLGEDLVLFRDGSGTVGLLAEQCPHRRAALWLGCTEDEGLRCGYHGWRFSASGECLEQPGEPADSTFKNRIRATAYPVRELGGLVFAYLGPQTVSQPAPELPRYDLFVWDDAWRDIGHAELPCNFVQIMENSVDPYHVEWLHGRYGNFLRELGGNAAPLPVVTKRHVKVAFEVFEHGILKRRVLEGHTEEDEDWKVGHPLVFPHMLRVGAAGLARPSRSGCRSTTRTPGTSGTRPTGPRAGRRRSRRSPSTRYRCATRRASTCATTSTGRTSSPGSPRAGSPTGRRSTWAARTSA
ncbi:MAG: Rieske 2Fe-2S domain-containing protein [Pseudonocardia sp.]|nr:Rieske 2Fe-2S domain-containing protein [Pseudonocardia sp.]